MVVEENESRGKYLNLLSQSFLLQGANPGAAERLLDGEARALRFTKGQRLAGEGLNQGCLGLVVSGRAVALSTGGLILRNFVAGDIFGAAALFAPSAEPFSMVMAESEGELLLLPPQNVAALLHEDGRVAENYIRFLAQRIVFLNRKIAALTAGEASKRLAAHIAANCRKDEVGRLIFSGNISKLAQSLNISRASLYRAVAQLSEQGLLHREGKIIVIDDIQHLGG